MMHAIFCFLVGLGAVGGSVGLFHLWVRLWHRLIFGSWRFEAGDREDDCFHSHIATFCLTVSAAIVGFFLYELGCGLRHILGI